MVVFQLICDPQGWNVFHYLAYRKGDIETDAFNLLVQKGGKGLLDKVNNLGESPLHFGKKFRSFSSKINVIYSIFITFRSLFVFLSFFFAF